MRKRATYQDVLDAPEHLLAEIIDGELRLTSRPNFVCALVTSIVRELGRPLRARPGGWLILHWPELHLGDDILVPDIAGWRRERMPLVPDEDEHFTIAPDWVCEVLSPATIELDRVHKLPIYARTGVSYAWLVEPWQRYLEAIRSCGSGWEPIAAHGDLDRARIEPFDAIELELANLWRNIAPSRVDQTPLTSSVAIGQTTGRTCRGG